MNQFKMRAVAAGVTTALGAATPLHMAGAVTLGEPGGALLIPLAVYDSQFQVNTLVGVTVGGSDPSTQGWDPFNQDGFFGDSYWTMPGFETEELCVGSESDETPITSNLHYYFFDAGSVHRADGPIPATCSDWVRVDWQKVVTQDHPELDGVPGYLVISSQYAHMGWKGIVGPNGQIIFIGSGDSSGESHFALYGAAYLIQGNWNSEAFIPVYPLADAQPWCDDPWPEIGCTDVVRGPNASGVPTQISPLVSGMQLDNNDGDTNDFAAFSLRYFLDPVLSSGTDLVVWLDHNNSAYGASPVDVYDSNEGSLSSTADLSHELNIISLTTNCTGLGGLCHEDPANDDLGFGSTIVNTGFVLFRLPEQVDTTIGMTTVGTSKVPIEVNGPARAGVAFSLVYLGAGSNAQQVQTELAHERGIIETD